MTGSKGNDFLSLGVTDPLEPILAKVFHWGTPQGPRKVLKLHFSVAKNFWKMAFFGL